MSDLPSDIRETNRLVIERFRADGGVGTFGPLHFERIVLLTTTGRHTLQRRTTPLGYARDDDGNLLLFASAMGAARHPDWYFNITVDPRVSVEITGRSWDADAAILTGEERDDAYRRWLEMAPHVAGHQEQAGRQIPMIRVPLPS